MVGPSPLLSRPLLRRVFALLCALLVCTALWAEAQQTQLADKVIRLHVVANSDSPADQALKLRVRDAVLDETDALLSGRESARQAAQVLGDSLPRLEAAARQALALRGSGAPVAVSLEDTWFPTRHYAGGALPAGTYQALRVVIGEGGGRNWWCVVFPALCLPAVSEPQARAAGLTGEDYALITESSPPYVFKFKALEWWGTCKGALLGKD